MYVEYLIQNGHMSEHEARKKFCQIVKAVDYCHQHNIVHRDLKVKTVWLLQVCTYVHSYTCVFVYFCNIIDS